MGKQKPNMRQYTRPLCQLDNQKTEPHIGKRVSGTVRDFGGPAVIR